MNFLGFDWVLAFKPFHFFLNPIGLSVTLTVLAVLLLMLNFRKTAIMIMLCGLFTIWIFSTPWIATLLNKKLSDIVLETPFEELGEIDAIVVFSNLTPINKGGVLYRTENQDLYKAVAIYSSRPKPVSIIITSSYYPPAPRPLDNENPYAREFLLRAGIAEQDITVLAGNRNTYEAALSVQNHVDKLKLRHIVLTDSDLKIPRKYLVLKKLFSGSNVELVAYSNRAAAGSRPPQYDFKHWVPNVDELKQSSLLLHEWQGLVAYKLKGWL